jgi:hypothetical protein
MGVLTLLLDELLLRWSFIVVVAQGLLNLFGVGLMVGLCLYRQKRAKHDDVFLPMMRDKMTAIACGIDDEDDAFSKLTKTERAKVKNLILPILPSLQGESFKKLADLYRALDFHIDDYYELRDRNFAVRLAAIARLESVADKAAAEVIRPLLRDVSPYVHFAALRFMLKFTDYHPKIHAEMKLASFMNRYDAAREILDLYSRNHLEQFIELFERYPDPKIQDVCLDVIQKNRLVGALPVVLDKLIEALRSEGHEEFKEFNFKKVTQCLTIGPMAEAEDVLMRMTEVEDSHVRACGYRALFKLRPDLKFEMVKNLAEDSSPSIKRIYAEVKEELERLGVAA